MGGGGNSFATKGWIKSNCSGKYNVDKLNEAGSSDNIFVESEYVVALPQKRFDVIHISADAPTTIFGTSYTISTSIGYSLDKDTMSKIVNPPVQHTVGSGISAEIRTNYNQSLDKQIYATFTESMTEGNYEVLFDFTKDKVILTLK